MTLGGTDVTLLFTRARIQPAPPPRPPTRKLYNGAVLIATHSESRVTSHESLVRRTRLWPCTFYYEYGITEQSSIALRDREVASWCVGARGGWGEFRGRSGFEGGRWCVGAGRDGGGAAGGVWWEG